MPSLVIGKNILQHFSERQVAKNLTNIRAGASVRLLLFHKMSYKCGVLRSHSPMARFFLVLQVLEFYGYSIGR